MKKIILTVVTAAVCAMQVNAQQRTILYEEFTGENCGPCAGANPGLEAMMASNQGKIIHVTFMEPIPSTGYFYKSVKALNDSRYGCQTAGYYSPVWTSLGSCFTPSGYMDGIFPDSTTATSGCGNCGNVAAFQQSDIDAEYTVPSPFTITATHYFSAANDSVYGQVIIQGASPIGGHSLKLRAAFVKTMNFTHEPGNNGETHFENVARAMFPSESGQVIAASWTTSTIDTYKYSGKIANLDTFTNVTVVDSNFVVWIQNDSTTAAPTNGFRVKQAALSVYTAPHVHTAGIAPVTTAPISMNIYPNPAKESATVYFTLGATSQVGIIVIDELGRTVKTIPAQNMNAGNQSITVDTKTLAPGVYTVAAQVNGTLFKQMLSISK